MVLTSAAGYVGPGLMGLGAAYLLHVGHAVGVLWLALFLLAALLLQIRNFYGLYAVLVVGVGVFAFSWWASPPVQVFVAHVGTWFVLLAAPRAVLELQAHRRRGRARTSDADMLARLTGSRASSGWACSWWSTSAPWSSAAAGCSPHPGESVGSARICACASTWVPTTPASSSRTTWSAGCASRATSRSTTVRSSTTPSTTTRCSASAPPRAWWTTRAASAW